MKNLIHKLQSNLFKHKKPTEDFDANLNQISQLKNINSVAIIYYVPNNSIKFRHWHDGFTAAIKLLEENNFFAITWINIAIKKPSLKKLNSFDFILVKSDWNWIPDKFIRQEMKGILTKKGLMISGVSQPPIISEMTFYDVLWYETYWYKNQIKDHPNIVHGFGVDTSYMYQMPQIEKKYDWLTIGAFKDYKRHDLFAQKPGKKIAIGDINSPQAKTIINEIKKQKVEVRNFLPYDEVAKIINQSKNVYIPATVHGGGERAVLEARACGVNVEIADDNPKLKELLQSPIWDHHYYSRQIRAGILSTLEK